MHPIDEKFLKANAVFFEPADLREVGLIQRRLFDLGYVWKNGGAVLAHELRCLRMGITAMPDGQLLCGMPGEVNAVTRSCYDLFAPQSAVPKTPPASPAPRVPYPVPSARVHAPSVKVPVDLDRVAAEVAAIGQQIEKAALDSRTQAQQVKNEMAKSFTDLARRQKDLEDGQRRVMDRLDELIALLSPQELQVLKKDAPKL